jgi:hypothetical protein
MLKKHGFCTDLKIKKKKLRFQTERLTNMSAVAANLKKETKLTSSGENEETFEMKYNRACYLLAQGKWEEAEKVSRGYLIEVISHLTLLFMRKETVGFA